MATRQIEIVLFVSIYSNGSQSENDWGKVETSPEGGGKEVAKGERAPDQGLKGQIWPLAVSKRPNPQKWKKTN